MPTISSFFGITIRMYYDDHSPPHFHAYYGSDATLVEIQTMRVMEGRMPRRAMGMILEWATQHRDELATNWDLAQKHEPLVRIDPLD